MPWNISVSVAKFIGILLPNSISVESAVYVYLPNLKSNASSVYVDPVSDIGFIPTAYESQVGS